MLRFIDRISPPFPVCGAVFGSCPPCAELLQDVFFRQDLQDLQDSLLQNRSINPVNLVNPVEKNFVKNLVSLLET